MNFRNFSSPLFERLNSRSPRRKFRKPILANLQTDFGFDIPENQQENLANLRQVIEDSVDNPPTQEDIQQVIANLQEIASDGTITTEERQLILENIQQRISNLNITADEVENIKLAVQQIVIDSPFDISEVQKENLADLKQVVKDSVDNPPTREDIQQAGSNFQDIIADGTITDDERQLIKENAQEAISNLGITADEAENIKLAVQQIIGDSKLPEIVDRFSGMTGNNGFSGFEEDDSLMRRNRRGDQRANILSRVSESDRFALIKENFASSQDSLFSSDLISELGIMVNSEDLMELQPSNAQYILGNIREKIQTNFSTLDQTQLYTQVSEANPEMIRDFISNKFVMGV